MGMASAVAVAMMLVMLVFMVVYYPARAARGRQRMKPRAGASLFNLVAWAVVLAVAFPLIWMVITSVKPQSELFRIPPTFCPETMHASSTTARLLSRDAVPHLLPQLADSVDRDDVLVVAVATLGAYSLVRFRYPGRETAGAAGALHLPAALGRADPAALPDDGLARPRQLAAEPGHRLHDLRAALCALAAALLHAGIPEDLESAALVDGASRMGAFVDVILPQALPGIISTALFTFILSWNEYLYALVLVNSDAARPLTTGVMNMLVTSFNIEWSLLMAASVMMSVPLIVIFAFLQSYLTRGFGAGGVKG